MMLHKKIYTICLLLIYTSFSMYAQCYELDIEGGDFEVEPLDLEEANEISWTICNREEALPMDPNGGVRINFCPAVNNLLQVTVFEGSAMSYFQMGSFFNCSIAEQFTTIPAGCFEFTVSYEVREESEIGEYSTDTEETGVHCIRTNIIPSGILIGNNCNNKDNDYHQVCSYSVGDSTMVSVDNALLPDLQSTVFPNPATDQIQVDLVEGVSSIEMINLQGEILLSETVEQDAQLSIKRIPAGVYIVQFLNNKQAILSTQKLFIFR